jgi:broad specificity phosphatase PhoE
MSPTNGGPTGGSPEKFRGSSEIPLTNQGVQGAHDLAMKLAQKGGLDEIMTSGLGRTVHTAKIISHYTHAPITYIGDKLHPWHLGPLEGTDVTPEKIDLINHLIKQEPDAPLPGRGPLSTADGESFNSFKERTLPFLAQVIRKVQMDPTKKIGLVTHYRVKRLLDSYMQAGMPDDGTIDANEMTRHDMGTPPGSLDRLSADPDAGPQMHSVDLDNPARLLGGAYFIRHEATPWNGSQS